MYLWGYIQYIHTIGTELARGQKLDLDHDRKLERSDTGNLIFWTVRVDLD